MNFSLFFIIFISATMTMGFFSRYRQIGLSANSLEPLKYSKSQKTLQNRFKFVHENHRFSNSLIAEIVEISKKKGFSYNPNF